MLDSLGWVGGCRPRRSSPVAPPSRSDGDGSHSERCLGPNEQPGDNNQQKYAKVGGNKGRKGKGEKTRQTTQATNTKSQTHSARENKRVHGKSHRTKCKQTDNKPQQDGTSSSGDASASRIFCSPHPFPHSPLQAIHNNDRFARVHASPRLQSQRTQSLKLQ